MSTQKSLILLGAGGHAKVLLSIIQLLNLPILGVCAPELLTNGTKTWRGLDVLGQDADIKKYSPEDVHLINGIGQRVDSTNRSQIFEKYKKQGYYFPPLVHPQAYVDASALLEEGVQVMAGAVIQADARIGENTIINTQSSIDHDCMIGAQVHIAPGAVLCGSVHVAPGSFIATGARLAPGIKIEACSVIGAGAVIVRDVPAHSRVLSATMRYANTSSETWIGET